MCYWTIRPYSCGCVKKQQFFQCQANRDTNVKCNNIGKITLQETPHYCERHMVKRNNDPMRR